MNAPVKWSSRFTGSDFVGRLSPLDISFPFFLVIFVSVKALFFSVRYLAMSCLTSSALPGVSAC